MYVQRSIILGNQLTTGIEQLHKNLLGASQFLRHALPLEIDDEQLTGDEKRTLEQCAGQGDIVAKFKFQAFLFLIFLSAFPF